MALRRYALGVLRLAGASPLDLRQINQRSVSPQVEQILNSAAGSFSPAYGVISDVDPKFEGTTTEISRFLTAVSPLSGLAIKSGNTYTSVEAYYSRKLEYGGRQTGSNHLKVVMVPAMAIPNQLQARSKAEATLTFTIQGSSVDGVTSPITYTDSVALPTAVYPDQKYTLGPIKVGSTHIDGITEATLDFGLAIDTIKQKGFPYNEFPSIQKLAPVLSFKSSNLELPTTYAPAGTSPASAITFYLRKFQQSSITYADASTEHMSFVIPASQYMIVPMEASGSNADDGMQSYQIVILEGASALITITSGVAIT